MFHEEENIIHMNSSLQSPERLPSKCFLGCVYSGRPHPYARACFILIITINILICPFTTVLNALVMIAVKVKPRLRAHKSNILLAALASTDFVVGLIVQPVFIASLLAILLEETSRACSLQRLTRMAMNCLWYASLLHLALLSGERFLAMKQPFAHITLLTTPRLLAASASAWLLSVILHIPLAFDRTVFFFVNSTFVSITLAFIIFCHVTVYRETRRHKQQIVAQTVTQEAKVQFKREQKAFKLTLVILGVLLLCYLPLVIFRIFFFKYSSEMSNEACQIMVNLAASLIVLNSLFNPVIYSVRMKTFRIAFSELICRTLRIADTGNLEMPGSGVPNRTVIRLEASQTNMN